MDFEQESKFGRIFKVAGPCNLSLLLTEAHSGDSGEHEWV